MDRNREVRRGGSGGGPVFAPRRPRTSGLKDSSVVEEDDTMDDSPSLRLRERGKRESNSISSLQGGYSGNTTFVSRNKRKRQRSHEAHIQAARNIPGDDLDETTDDTEMGASEDDDDLPPPPITRRPAKPKLQGKSLDEENAVDLSSVPRKARTAKSAHMRRPQESPPPPVVDGSRPQSLATGPSSTAPLTTELSSSNPALKPGRRTKLNGSKHRASKVPKVSTSATISEQEVEVAEALFDLARMVPNQASPSVSESKSDVKPDSKPDPKSSLQATATSPPVSVRSPAVSSAPAQVCAVLSAVSVAPVTSPSSALATSALPAGLSLSPVLPVPVPQAEAPRRKRPRVRPNTEDGAHAVAQTVVMAVDKSVGVTSVPNGDTKQIIRQVESDQVQVKVESSFVGSSTEVMASTGSPHASASGAVSTPPSSVQWPYLMEKRHSNAKIDVSNFSTAEKLQSAPVTDRKNVLSGSPGSIFNQKDRETSSELPSTGGKMTRLELAKRPAQSPLDENTHAGKFELDLMAPPKTAASGTTEMIVNADKPGVMKWNEIRQKDVATGLTKLSWLDWEKEKEREKDGKSYGDKVKYKDVGGPRDLNEVKGQEASLDFGSQGEKEIQNSEEREGQKEKSESTKQPSQRMGKCMKTDSRLPKSEKSASPFLISAPSTSSGSAINITSPSLPLSMGMAGWPGGLPPLGYYSPAAAVAAAAAAAWPATAPINGPPLDESSTTAAQVPPFIFPGAQKPWKRCATHVYIAHFVDWQQQMQQHPLWAATYGNAAAGLYGSKPYNLNMPVPPADAILGNGSGNLTGNTGPGSKGSGLVLGSLKDMGSGTTANGQGLKEKVPPSAYFDALARKVSSKQPAQVAQQQPSLSLQTGAPAFGFPVTQGAGSPLISSVPSAATGSQVSCAGSSTLISSSSGVGNSATIGSGTGAIVGQGVGTTNESVVNAAAVQVQYLQAMIQQTGFPFSFPPSHFGPTFNGPPGHITQQQATQYFGNPFYSTPLVHAPLHSQQVQSAVANVSSGPTSSQKQQHFVQQGARNFQISGSQQQRPPPSPSPSQSQQQHSLGTSQQQLYRSNEREGNMGGENSSTAESKLPSSRNAYSQATSNMIHPPSVLAAGMPGLPHPQDVSLMASFSGKQPGKPHSHQQQASVQSHSQQQVSVSSPLQQHATPALHHPANPGGIQMSLKGLDPQVSQAFSVISTGNISRSSVGTGPLGLAPVAAVIAPQGHAMLQSVGDPARGHTHPSHPTLSGQSHQHSIPQGQQHHPTLMQKLGSSGVDENRLAGDDSNYTSSGRGRESGDDRKMPVQRGLVHTGFSRVDLEASSSAHASPTGGNGGGLTVSRMMSSSGAPLHVMASPIGNLTRHTGQSSGSIPGQMSSANQSLKPVASRTKANANVASASSPSSADSSLSSLADRTLGATLSKAPVPGLPFPGYSVNSGNPNLRQGHSTQHTTQHQHQIKPAQRAIATAPGTPAIVSATAMAKHQVQSRGQPPGMSTVPSSRLSTGTSGSSASSSIHLPPLTPVSKPSTAGVSKNAGAVKGSVGLTQKQAGHTPAKRSGNVVAATHGSILVPSPMSQSMPAKVSQLRQQQQVQPSLQQQQHLSHTQNQASLTAAHQTIAQAIAQQYHQQQAHIGQFPTHPSHHQSLHPQPIQMRQQFIIQQQAPQSQGHSPASQPQGMAHSTQLQSGHPVQHQLTSSATQNHQQIIKQVHHPQQVLESHHQYSLPGSFGVATNGGHSLSPPNLTSGSANIGRTVTSNGASSQVAVSKPAKPLKCAGSSGDPPSAASSQKGSSSVPMLHSQGSSSNGAISGQQQYHVLGTTSPYLQPVPNSSPVAKLTEEKANEIVGQDQTSIVRVVPGASLGRPVQSTSGAAPSLPSSSLGSQVAVSTVKLTGGQHFTTGNMVDSLAPRSGFIASSHPGTISSSSPLSSGPNITNGPQSAAQFSSDGKAVIGTASATLHHGGGQSQPPISSSGQPMTAMTVGMAASVASSGPAVMIGQNSGLVKP